MRKARYYFFLGIDILREFVLLVALSLPHARKSEVAIGEPFIVAGLTSYPGRIRHAWIAIECLLRQSLSPQRLFLVLSEEEFPSKALPRRIRQQSRRGLEILWVSRNGKSFDKLLPILERFPQAAIMTFDDDKYFPRTLVQDLVAAHQALPGHVVGARGWAIKSADEPPKVRYGVNWARALPGEHGHHLFLPGGNGTLYPPGALDCGVTDLGAALELCPTADDIWFWGHTQKKGTPMFCLGHPPHRPVRAASRGPNLTSINSSQNNIQMQRVINFLGIRQRVESEVLLHAKLAQS